MKKAGTIEVGLAQINPTVGDFKGNTEKICTYIDSAERQGLDLVVFPELAVSGYPVWDLANKAEFVQKDLDSLKRIVAQTRGKRVTAVVGFIDLAGSGSKKNFNALAVIRNGKIVHKQYKTLLPTYDVFLEEIFFSPAKTHNIFSLKNTCLGACICEDIWDDLYPIKPASILSKKGARVVINISASPYHREVVKVRSGVVFRKAKEYGVWIVYVNQVGGQDDLIFDGRSFICDPKGHLYFQADPFREALFRVSLDLRARKSPYTPPREVNQVREMHQALVMGLFDYLRKNRFRKVVIGLSGGIDSALVAVLARDALGPNSVIGVSMPGPFSSPGSVTDARELARRLGIEFRVKPIRALYQKFVGETISEKGKRKVQAVEKQRITVAMENLQARLRALELMYLSNDEGALLLTTGNKSELAMGYSTLYGDMCGGLSVIGDVYKTDVYRLVQYRNRLSKVIPESIIKKAPSAELRPNQKDRDSLPPYSVLDRILYLYIEKNLGFKEILKLVRSKGISGETVWRVIRTVDLNEYKRRQLPPALRITEKAWFGRRMPITNRFKD